ncbi:hypothetical protein EVAR_70815_1 [Eumeta japonica]|uniref:Uncharacterized protein n=1 Tax=Eumeta variegata TaxID=151549 RepID=A0A4C2A929_EUMVA|nr:hypothetical protein EVAR_70815_1 [Eumeta japonica]
MRVYGAHKIHILESSQDIGRAGARGGGRGQIKRDFTTQSGDCLHLPPDRGGRETRSAAPGWTGCNSNSKFGARDATSGIGHVWGNNLERNSVQCEACSRKY